MAELELFSQQKIHITSEIVEIVGVTNIDGSLSLNSVPITPSTPITLANVGNSPNAQGATLTGSVFRLQPCSQSEPGVLVQGEQDVPAGNKNFVGTLRTYSGDFFPEDSRGMRWQGVGQEVYLYVNDHGFAWVNDTWDRSETGAPVESIVIGNNAAANHTLPFQSNVVIGNDAAVDATTASSCLILGRFAFQHGNGNGNVHLGYEAGQNLVGDRNLTAGFQAGSGNASGNDNMYLLHAGSPGESGRMRIGTPGVQTECNIAGITGVSIGGGVPVVVDAFGQLGITVSARRYKEQIQPIKAELSKKVMELEVKTFVMKDSKAIGYGLIAEEVEAVLPDAVVYNAQKVIETVDYQKITMLLLHQVQCLMGEVAELKKLNKFL